MMIPSTLIVLGLSALLADEDAAAALPPPAASPVDFDRDIRPILGRNCIRCHGPKRQEGGLRLHTREDALAGGDSGPAIVMGRSAESRLIRYVAGLDEEIVMPPEGFAEPLGPEQVGLLRAWIDQGVTWSEAAKAERAPTHWAFVPPVRPELPEVADRAWVRNPIDRFVLARLEKDGLRPSPEADRTTLIRRLSLDLIGLPPTIAEVEDFVADGRPDAYERLVERLLASPHYGERWGRRWLDAARYADTNGYEKDRARSIWPYRDWVVRSLNEDLPFDRFTVEQLAGDLLPGATVAQKVATGFHRNTMINEEGGIDVEEFRYASLVDRVATTGAVWLGLTIQCAQCHSHKYDPITQREYYGFLAFFNNADEPDLTLPDPEVAARREAILGQVAALEAGRADRFPDHDPAYEWDVLAPVSVKSSGGSTLTAGPDGTILAGGPSPERDSYEVTFEVDPAGLDVLRLEALTDPSLPRTGPGRAANGNFVLSEVVVTAAPAEGEGKPVPVRLSRPEADAAQPGFDIAAAIDGRPRTGWAIDDGSGHPNADRAATFRLKDRIPIEGRARLTVRLEQSHGGAHTLGRFRIAAGREVPAEVDETVPVEDRRRAHLAAKRAAWEARQRPARWTVLAPSRLVSKKHATMTVLADQSVLVGGDKPNNDTYEVELPTDLEGITALRLEVLPDESLPDGGPGRAPLFSVGDFLLTEAELSARPEGQDEARPVTIAGASEDFAEPGKPAALAIDGKSDTGWAVKGGIGRPHAAVFALGERVGDGRGTRLVLTLHQEYIHQMTIGRFRISATTDPGPVRASGMTADVEAALLAPREERTGSEDALVLNHYLSVAPELAVVNAEIETLRGSLPAFPTTMVMQERAPEHARTTHIHKRGEFLKPGDPVEPGVPAVLPGLPEGAPRDRLTLARWLVDGSNPLTARVVVNRIWAAYFGRGLVATVEDFGTRGERPTHPELLDWLATEFPRRGWSPKALHRLIVTSATYRQSSRATPEALARDPNNERLARGARFRVEAEVIRDLALEASGLLNPEIGGPSVFPPQPDGVTALAYGKVAWPTSSGPDRYRRGLYTYFKRTAPYAASLTFDAPTAETACVRRERSNTPLQALTLLNDAVFVEAARALAGRILEEGPADTEGRARYAFRLCVARAPTEGEVAMLTRFYEDQVARFRGGDLDAAKVAGADPEAAPERAAWTAVARVLLNLDETITRE